MNKLLEWSVDILIDLSIMAMRVLIWFVLGVIKVVATFSGNPMVWNMYREQKERYEAMNQEFEKELERIDREEIE